MSNKTAQKRAHKKKDEARKQAQKEASPPGSGGLARKLKRKSFTGARKKFMKDFKSRMASFKKQVKCSECGHHPIPGENIDDWHIDKNSEGVDLICTGCYTGEEIGEET